MNRLGYQTRNTEEMYRRTNMAANLSEHDIFAKANAPICELTNKGFIFVIQVKDVLVQEIQVSRSYF